MSKVAKGIGKAVKGIVKGVKKVFKKITSSKLGRGLLIAATIYLGGAALGAWQVPSSVPFSGSINNAFIGTGESAATAAVGEGVAGTAVEAAAAGGAPVVESIGVTASGVPSSSLPTSVLGGGVVTPASAAAPVATGEAVAAGSNMTQSIVGRLLGGAQKAAGWAADNPIPAAMGLNAAAKAFSPDALDLQNEVYKREDDERKRREKNMNVAGIDLGVASSGEALSYSDGTPVYGDRGFVGGRLLGGGNT